MGKPKNFGGKKHRRGKNIQISNKVDIPDEGQYIGCVNQILGGGFVSITYYIPTAKNNSTEWIKYEKKGKIRGKMMRRIWINVNDIVLITEREFDSNTIDIISKFTHDNIDYLKKHNVPIPNINNMFNNDILFSNEIDNQIDSDTSDYGGTTLGEDGDSTSLGEGEGEGEGGDSTSLGEGGGGGSDIDVPIFESGLEE